MQNIVNEYFAVANSLPLSAKVSGADGMPVPLGDGFQQVLDVMEEVKSGGRKFCFVGNGGSAAIASHMAVDFSKRCEIRTQDLNSSAMLTCLGNDFGYAEVFSKQIELNAEPGDALIAISSSGKSANILNAVSAAVAAKCTVVSFSGFGADNPLRTAGNLNFYIGSPEYGFVELTHMALISAIIDIFVGWRPGIVLGR